MGVPAKGEIWVDAGAVRAVRDARKSLFSAGITKVMPLYPSPGLRQYCRHGYRTAGSMCHISCQLQAFALSSCCAGIHMLSAVTSSRGRNAGDRRLRQP